MRVNGGIINWGSTSMKTISARGARGPFGLNWTDIMWRVSKDDQGLGSQGMRLRMGGKPKASLCLLYPETVTTWGATAFTSSAIDF